MWLLKNTDLRFFGDVEAAVAAFASTESFDVGVVGCEAVDDAAVGGVKFEDFFDTGFADFFDPFFSLVFEFVGALAFIIGDIDIYARNFGIAGDKSHHKDVLESAEIVSIFSDKKRVNISRGDGKLNDVIFDCGGDSDIDTEK